MEEESDDSGQVSGSDSESTHEDELESQSQSSKQSRPSIELENESKSSSDEAEHEAIFNQIKSKYNNKKRSKTPSPIATRSSSQSSKRRSNTPSISHHSVNSSNSVPVFDRLYAESYALRKKREEEIKNREEEEMKKYSSKKRSTSTPVKTNSVYSPDKIKKHYEEREIYIKEQQMKAEEEKMNNERWLCPLCSYSNVMKDKICMNPMKGGAVKVTIQNLKKCKSQQMEEVLVCGCKQPKLGTPFICKRSKDLMNTPGQNTFQSLYEDSVCRKDRREVLQKEDEEKMNKVYTYTPTLNKHSVNIVNRKGDRDKNIGEYLYKQFQLKLKNSNNLELESSSKSTSSSKSSHLHPYTNETQKEFCDRLYRDGERKELLRKMKESERLQYDEDGHKLFQPHITREPLIINRDPDLDIYTYLHALSYTQNQKLQLLKENYEDEEQYEIDSGKQKNNHTDKVTKRKSEWFFKKVFSIMIDSETFDNFDEVIIDKSVIEKDYSVFRKECQEILKCFFLKYLNKKFTFIPFSHSLYKYVVKSTGGRFAFVTAPQAKVNIPTEIDEKEMLFSPKINPKSHQILKNSEHYNNSYSNNNVNNNNQSIYTTLYEDHLNHQKRLEHLKELYLSQQCEEYTFQPQVGRKPQYDLNNTTIRTSTSNTSKNSNKRSTPMKVDHSIYKEEEFDDYDNNDE